jgi:hypothetical protein
LRRICHSNFRGDGPVKIWSAVMNRSCKVLGVGGKRTKKTKAWSLDQTYIILWYPEIQPCSCDFPKDEKPGIWTAEPWCNIEALSTPILQISQERLTSFQPPAIYRHSGKII